MAHACVAFAVIALITCAAAHPQPRPDGSIVERSDDLFPVSIIHINDFHARFEETNERSISCKPGEKCIGGLARAVHVIKSLLDVRKNAHPLYLNAGDNFQGTLWYNIGRWNVTAQFLNMLKADAMTLGNHEFDHHIEGVVPFMENIDSPILMANIDDSEEPTMQGKYQKSIIIDRYDRKIGIIGVVLSTYDQIANTDKLKFLNESDAVRAEATKLKQQGVNIIIVLSHCGLDVDYQIARNAGPDVDVIVGGHSHTFMFTGTVVPGPDKPRDEYPAVVTHDDGHKVLIVQASAYLKYVGDITVYFDRNGRVASWEGAPIFLDTDIKQDEGVLEALKPWRAIIDAEGARTLGTTLFPLQKGKCSSAECNLGNFVADAFVYYYATRMPHGPNEWTSASIALVQVGGLRTPLDRGSITYGDLKTVLPFENTVDIFELRGEHLREALEFSTSASTAGQPFSSYIMLQVSGLKVVYNVTKPVNERVVSVDVLCQQCLEPHYEPLNPNMYYRVIGQNFLAGGGDGFQMIDANKRNYRTGDVDFDVVSHYLESVKVVATGTDQRMTMLT